MSWVSCPSCGRADQSGGRFCIFCGASIPWSIVPLKDHDVRSLRTRLEPIVNGKHRAEREISIWWAIAPLIALIVVSAAITLAFLAVWIDLYDPDGDPDEATTALFDALGSEVVVGLQAASMAAYAMFALLTYNLVKRENVHFEREKRFKEEIVSLVPRPRGDAGAVRTPGKVETRRFPTFWAAVVLIPEMLMLTVLVMIAAIGAEDDSDLITIVLGGLLLLLLALPFVGLQFYMFCFLNAEMLEHHKRWCWMVKETKVFLARIGYAAGTLTEPRPLPDRSNVVYVIVSLVTSGLFFFYWWYALVKDGNEHIRHHERFERELLELLSRRPTTDQARVATPSA
jgi:hypothetical protein